MEDDFTDFKIGIAGLGLIGGSLAKAFKSDGFYVAGFDTDRESAYKAKECGAADITSASPEVLFTCDVIFAALYPEGIIDFVKTNAGNFKKGSVIVDCCGIKGHVCKSLYSSPTGGNFTFIGGHPMAGTEQSGFSASSPDMFKGASFILTPRPDEDKTVLDRIKRIIKKAGFARIVITTPQHHDRMIAFTSQLPHIIACSYVMSPSCPDHDGFSAGSFRDVSRVAHINSALWPQLFIDNKTELCAEIDTLINNILKLRGEIEREDAAALRAMLEKARKAKDDADS